MSTPAPRDYPTPPDRAPGSPTCAVVICAYTDDRWNETLRADASVQSQQPPADELIVVIDHNPGLQERIAAALPGVRVVANHNEQGLSGARNSGVELCESDVVVFLDDDAAAQPGWLAGLARHYADPHVLGVGGRIEPEWATERPAWWPPEFDWVVGCDYTGQAQGKVRNLMGASSSFRRDLFDDGGFVTGIGRSATVQRPVGCEETEFCIRSTNNHPGGYFIHDAEPAVRHSVPASRENFAYFKTRCYAEGLSKAQVTESVGTSDGLSAEWTYSAVTLPLGVLRGLWRTLRGDFAGLLTAVAIILGLGYTTAGYIVGRAQNLAEDLRGGPR